MAEAQDEPGTGPRPGAYAGHRTARLQDHDVVAGRDHADWVTELDRTPETLREARESLVPTARLGLFGTSPAALDRAAREAHPHIAFESHHPRQPGSRWLVPAGIGAAVVCLAFIAAATISLSSRGTPLPQLHLDGAPGLLFVTSWGFALVAGVSFAVQTALRSVKDRRGDRDHGRIVVPSDVVVGRSAEPASTNTYGAEIDMALRLLDRSSEPPEAIRTALRANPLVVLRDRVRAEGKADWTAGERRVLESLERHLGDPRMGPALARSVRRIYADTDRSG